MPQEDHISIDTLFKYRGSINKDEVVSLLEKSIIEKEKLTAIIDEAEFDREENADVLAWMVEECVNKENPPQTLKNNLTAIIRESSLQGKERKVIKLLTSRGVFAKLEGKKGADIFMAIYSSINDISVRKRIVSSTNKLLLKEIITSCDGKDKEKLYLCREIISFKDPKLLECINDGIKNGETATFLGFIKAGKGVDVVEETIEGLENEEFAKITHSLDEHGQLVGNIVGLPPSAINRLDPKLLRKGFKKMNAAERALVLGVINNPKKHNYLIKDLDSEERQQVVEEFNHQTSVAQKYAADSANANTRQILDNKKTIKRNEMANRLEGISRAKEQAIATLLERKMKKQEHKLSLIARAHSSGDKVGVIETIKLKSYMRKVAKYQKLSEKYNNRKENIDAIDTRRMQRIEEIEKLKSDLVARKKALTQYQRDIVNVGKTRGEQRENLIRAIQKSPIPISRGDKVGKIGRTANNIKNFDTGISEIKTKVEPIVYVGKDTLEMLYYINGDKIKENNGLSKAGLSNYAFITAITALTITGLIILLTVILS